jgi:hypothetical protein
MTDIQKIALTMRRDCYEEGKNAAVGGALRYTLRSSLSSRSSHSSPPENFSEPALFCDLRYLRYLHDKSITYNTLAREDLKNTLTPRTHARLPQPVRLISGTLDRLGAAALVSALVGSSDCYPGARLGTGKEAGCPCDRIARRSFRQPCALSARLRFISATCLRLRTLATVGRTVCTCRASNTISGTLSIHAAGRVLSARCVHQRAPAERSTCCSTLSHHRHDARRTYRYASNREGLCSCTYPGAHTGKAFIHHGFRAPRGVRLGSRPALTISGFPENSVPLPHEAR